jgi:3-hydroxyacyl-CoA dehydrogenase
MNRFPVRKVAVLGAGVMGAQIAAHLANASVPVLLFDLAAKDGDPNGIAMKAVENLKKLEPSPLATKDRAGYIDAANYDQHLALLAGCDLVIEAISERMDWKKALYEKVAPHIGGHAIFASNTSGLSINALAEACPASLRSRFCGIHFFNPPRYMHLVELIAQKDTESTLLDQLETFLVTTLGKGVVRARDTPNFVANRVGVFSMLATMVHTERFGLGFDVVDAVNHLVETYAAQAKRVQYVDVNPVLFNRDGTPRIELYLSDELHFRPAAYEQFALILKPVLTRAYETP